MEYLDLTANSSFSRTLCAVGLNKIIKMLRLWSCLLLHIALSTGQVLPYGSTPGPFTPVPTALTPGVPVGPTGLPPVGPNGFPSAVGHTGFPFGPSPRPFLPGFNGYNNPYYNPTAGPAGPAVPILTYSSEHVGDGTYSFSYSTADGKKAQESGFLKDAYIDNAGEPQGTQVVQGSYAYVAPDGTPIQVSYVADENGFRPSGVHIPADGKGLPPPPVIDRKGNKIIDPFNRFDPYNRYDPNDPYRSRYNNYYNNPNAPYDPKYPYNNPRFPYNNPRYPYNNPINPFNPYRPIAPLATQAGRPATEGTKKESA